MAQNQYTRTRKHTSILKSTYENPRLKKNNSAISCPQPQTTRLLSNGLTPPPSPSPTIDTHTLRINPTLGRQTRIRFLGPASLPTEIDPLVGSQVAGEEVGGETAPGFHLEVCVVGQGPLGQEVRGRVGAVALTGVEGDCQVGGFAGGGKGGEGEGEEEDSEEVGYGFRSCHHYEGGLRVSTPILLRGYGEERALIFEGGAEFDSVWEMLCWYSVGACDQANNRISLRWDYQ